MSKYNLGLLKDRKVLTQFSKFANGMIGEKEVSKTLDLICKPKKEAVKTVEKTQTTKNEVQQTEKEKTNPKNQGEAKAEKNK